MEEQGRGLFVTTPDREKFRSCMPLLVKKQMNMREQEFCACVGASWQSGEGKGGRDGGG